MIQSVRLHSAYPALTPTLVEFLCLPCTTFHSRVSNNPDQMARLNSEVRSHESPMDWQWQEGHGPTDTNSPFLKGTPEISLNRESIAGLKRECLLKD